MVADREVFAHPPITEALIDIQVDQKTTIDILKTLHSRLEARYPKMADRFIWSGQLNFDKGMTFSPGADSGPDGVMFTSLDGLQVLQARTGGFTYSRLRPYPGWELFIAEAKNLWNHYAEVTKATTITRVALRYINRIELPLPMESLQDFLLTCPQVGGDLSRDVSEYFFRVALPFPDRAITAVVSEGLPSGNYTDYLPILLDFDIFAERSIPVVENGLLWSAINDIKEIRTDLFMTSITEKTKELFR